jgi:hypothetical protein
LEDVLQNTENVGKLASELGLEASGGDSDSGDDSPKGDE